MLKKELARIFELNVAQRIMIVEAIWDSILNNPEDMSVPESQIEELERRLTSYYENPRAGTQWDIVKERILSGN
jgi:putative addiction module component (TIGR02574 family)